jgi:hypothetical protein
MIHILRQDVRNPINAAFYPCLGTPLGNLGTLLEGFYALQTEAERLVVAPETRVPVAHRAHRLTSDPWLGRGDLVPTQKTFEGVATRS